MHAGMLIMDGGEGEDDGRETLLTAKRVNLGGLDECHFRRNADYYRAIMAGITASHRFQSSPRG